MAVKLDSSSLLYLIMCVPIVFLYDSKCCNIANGTVFKWKYPFFSSISIISPAWRIFQRFILLEQIFVRFWQAGARKGFQNKLGPFYRKNKIYICTKTFFFTSKQKVFESITKIAFLSRVLCILRNGLCLASVWPDGENVCSIFCL